MLTGFMYHKGDGVDVNYKKAIEWYEKAAQQGVQVLRVIWVPCTSRARAWM